METQMKIKFVAIVAFSSFLDRKVLLKRTLKKRLFIGLVSVLPVLLGSGVAHGGLLLNLDASTLGLSNGASVVTWGVATASGTPTFLTGQTPNGNSAVELNGADHFGSLGASYFPTSSSQDFIVAAVIKANNTGAYHNIIDDQSSNRPMLWIDSAFNYELNYGGGGGAKSVGTGTDGWDIVIMDSRNNQLYVNSATANATGGAAVPYSVPEGFDLFNRNGGQTFQGLVSELRVYNDTDSFGNNFGTLYTELNDKWFGAAIPEPSTLSIFALGLMGLASRRFKKKA
jgi:hypothetical protein